MSKEELKKKSRGKISKGGAKNTLLKKRSAKTKVIKKPPFLEKIKENPIISPRSENGWEAWQTFTNHRNAVH